MAFGEWFLSADERGNPWTSIDRRHPDGVAWTTGNSVRPLVHGAPYFERLYEVLNGTGRGDSVHFTDWRSDRDERLDGAGTEIGDVLVALEQRGVDVRGLVWRSHPHTTKFSEEENTAIADEVNEAGGEVLLDQRVRRGGSHHQKLVVVRHATGADDDVAFVGGIDLCHGRRDDERHLGDPQIIEIDGRYGPRPAWHDAQVELHGPVVGDLDLTFRERWEDPTRLDHRNPLRAVIRRMVRSPVRPGPLPPQPPDPAPVPGGTHVVQVLRTYPAKRPSYPFAPHGERSVARAYGKAFARARSLIYIEDQYLWSEQVAEHLARALRSAPDLLLIAVVPRFPDRDGRVSGPPNRIGQEAALDRVRHAGGERVAVYDLECETGWPIYVHAKVCVIDDVWAVVGSDNLNRRSWTHDSELSCAILDETVDEREPADPGGRGDRARRFARDLRMALWREHLGDDVTDEELLDPRAGFDRWRRTAEALDDWNRRGRSGERPPGRARVHAPAAVPRWAALWSRPAYEYAVDPDGRPRPLRVRDRY
jgi:phosphatidylserine/phosphatidylglycerophosphate/cardiolipin synthase-like enzyme